MLHQSKKPVIDPLASFPEPEPGEQRWEIFGERMSAREVEHVFGTPKARFLRRVDQGIEPEKAALNERVYGHKVSRHKIQSGRRVFRLRKAMGFGSPDELAAKAGMRPDRVVDYEYGMSPWSDQRCEWKICAKRLAEGLGMFPEEIWPRVARLKLPRMVQADDHSDPEAFDMGEVLDAKKLVEAILECLKHLSPRERWVIDERYGLSDGGPPSGGLRTLKEIGNKIGRSQERIRQFEGSALRRIRQILGQRHKEQTWEVFATTFRIPTTMQVGMTHEASGGTGDGEEL